MMLLSGGNFASSSVEMILLSIHQWLLLKVALHLWYHANAEEGEIRHSSQWSTPNILMYTINAQS